MRLGLRPKSVLAVGASAAVVLALSALLGAQVLGAVRQNLGDAFARNATQYNKQRLLTPVARELALSQRLADSQALKQWLAAPNDPAKRAFFFREAEGFRAAFADGSYFVADVRRRAYFFNDRKTPFSEAPRQIFDPNEASDAWFFNSIRNTQTYNINVDTNAQSGQTKVWINVLHRENGQKLAIAGTGLDLTQFLDTFIASRETGVTPLILSPSGAIQAHPKRELIALNSGTGQTPTSTIFDLMSESDAGALRKSLQKAENSNAEVQLLSANLDGKNQLLAISYLPELKWHVVTAVDLDAAQIIDTQTLLGPLSLVLAAIFTLLLLVVFAVNRVVLAPLLRLTDSVREVEKGRYDVAIPPASDDEIGDLSRAFGTMTAQIRAHTAELETLVQQRTQELRAAGQQIQDSIEYASLIQGAILPRREIADVFGESHSILWKPRDIVGGDIYAFREGENGYLIGLIDCAGHGVAGAFMTMIAHGALSRAIDEIGLENPAAILARFDAKIRETLGEVGKTSGVATNMDAALVYLDEARGELLYCGAHLPLFVCDGQSVTQIKGARAPLGGKKVPQLANVAHKVAPRQTFYLSTDGFLDQSGGEKGFSFGTTRFSDMILRHHDKPLTAQKEAFARELREYRGERSQRDDIGIVAFGLPPKIAQTTEI